MAIAVLSGLLLMVALAGAMHFLKFQDSHAAAVGTKLLHSQYHAHPHVALQQLSASLDRQLETLNQLEAKIIPSHLPTVAAPAHVAAAPQSRAVASSHAPEGKSESFLADIIGIQSPAMHSESVKSSQTQLGAQPSPSSCVTSSPFLFAAILALLAIFL